MFDPNDLIAALASAQVDYIVIGGFAVGAHGFPRATKDLDIVPEASLENLERLAAALKELGATNHDAGDFDLAEFPYDPLVPADLARGGNFLFIMQWVPGLPEDSAFLHLSAGAVSTKLGSYDIRVCSRDDLVAMKRAAGRPQDLIDLQALGV